MGSTRRRTWGIGGGPLQGSMGRGSVQEGSGRRHPGCQGPGAATGEPGRSSETQLRSIQV